MLKRLLLALSGALLLTGCAEDRSLFDRIDLDHNGVISRGEFTDGVADLSFARYDRNHDGMIDFAEWRAIEETGGHDDLFRVRDLSRNGKISRPEARLAAEKNLALHRLFARIDTNHDGVIDRNEARAFLATRQRSQRPEF